MRWKSPSLKWSPSVATGTPTAGKDESFAVDVLVVGGGVQGLVLLSELKRNGYSAVLVTNSDLGAGQTLHSHGILNSGYPYPREDLRNSLKQDWLPFARRNGLQLYGDNSFYMLIPPETWAGLREGWDAFGYAHETVPSTSLPTGLQDSDLFRESAQTLTVQIKEYTFPKRQLVRILAEGMQDRILRGDITAFHFAAEREESLGKGEGKTILVDSAEIRIQSTGKRVKVRPGALVCAAGVGTKRLVESLTEDGSFARSVLELGGQATEWRDRVLSQIGEVACRNTHMLCIQAPGDVLPAVNLFVVEQRLMIIAANVNPSHDSVNRDPGDLVTWYVTPMDPTAVPAEDVPDTAQARVDENFVVEGFHKLMKVFPSLKTRAESADSKMKFAVYAGYKQDIGADKNRPFLRQIDGMDNVVVALPSLFTGAFVNARKVLALLDGKLVRAGSQPTVPGAGEGIKIGDVTENTDEVQWMTWPELLKAFPGIDARKQPPHSP